MRLTPNLHLHFSFPPSLPLCLSCRIGRLELEDRPIMVQSHRGLEGINDDIRVVRPILERAFTLASQQSVSFYRTSPWVILDQYKLPRVSIVGEPYAMLG